MVSLARSVVRAVPGLRAVAGAGLKSLRGIVRSVDRTSGRLLTSFDRHHVVVRYGGQTIKIAVDDKSDHIPATIAARGQFYELEMLEHVRQVVRTGELIVEVGANIGNHTAYFLSVIGARVIAVEPNPKVFQILRRTITVNSGEARTTLHNVGLGRSPGRATLFEQKGNSGATRLCPASSGDIEITTLDDIRPRDRIACIKIDVEGMEMDVLAGGESILAEDRPIFYVEVSEQESFLNVYEFMKQRDYIPLRRFNYTPTIVFSPLERIDVRGGALSFD